MPFTTRLPGFAINLPATAMACCVAVALGACARSQAPDVAPDTASHANSAAPSLPATVKSEPGPPPPADSAVPTVEPTAPQASLPEPGPAAINTPQAAATAVETYFALLDAGRTAEADAMWGDASQAAKFRADFRALGEYHAEVDAPGGLEGAAGSMYVTVPVRFVPAASVANPRPHMGEVLVRRVNDVPGSTDAQRRWHVERIDVAMTPK
jgi:hypothetical protein